MKDLGPLIVYLKDYHWLLENGRVLGFETNKLIEIVEIMYAMKFNVAWLIVSKISTKIFKEWVNFAYIVAEMGLIKPLLNK